MLLRSAVAPSFLLLACATNPAPSSSAAGSRLGCYTVTWGAWSDSIAPTWLRPGPSAVRLHATGSLTPGWVLSSPIDTLRGSWRSGSDSLFLDWSDGSNGVAVALTGKDGELMGMAKTWSGEVFGVASWPTASVRARQERCS